MLTPEIIEQARKNVMVGIGRKKRSMNAVEAGAIIHKSGRMWSRYEKNQSEMDIALFELFIIKTGQTLTVSREICALLQTPPKQDG